MTNTLHSLTTFMLSIAVILIAYSLNQIKAHEEIMGKAVLKLMQEDVYINSVVRESK